MHSCGLELPTERIGTYETQLVEHFFQSLANTSGMTLHIRQVGGYELPAGRCCCGFLRLAGTSAGCEHDAEHAGAHWHTGKGRLHVPGC